MQVGLLHRSNSILMVFNPILCYLSPKILIFQEPLIMETWNKCHWIQHASNPKCAPLKPFQYISPCQNQQNVKFLPEIVIFQEPLIIETWNLCHWIWHAWNSKYTPLNPFQCIFPSQNQKICESFGCLLNSPWHKIKNPSIWTGKKCLKRLENLHI